MMDDLERVLLAPGGAQGSAWVWGTVTALAPLRVRLDGEAAALDVTPASLVAGLRVGDRVWAQIAGRRLVLHGSPSAAARVPRGLLARLTSTSQETSSSTTTYAEIPGLSLPGAPGLAVGPGTRSIAVTVACLVSVTGSGTFKVLGRVRTGASAVVCAARTGDIPTNGNAPLVLHGTVQLAEGAHNISLQLAPLPGATVRLRGDIDPAELTVTDLGGV